MKRRKMIENMAGAAVVTAANPLNRVLSGATEQNKTLKGNIHHSVSQWCYNDIPLDQFAKACKDIGHIHTGGVPGRHKLESLRKSVLICNV